jgi:hypothetical protein
MGYWTGSKSWMKMRLEYWPGTGRRMMDYLVPWSALKGPSLTSGVTIVIVEDLSVSLVDNRDEVMYP